MPRRNSRENASKQIGDVTVFSVASSAQAHALSKQLQTLRCVQRVELLTSTKLRLTFRERHNNQDKQPALDLIDLYGIANAS